MRELAEIKMQRLDYATHSYVDMEQVLRLNQPISLPPIKMNDTSAAPDKITAVQAPHLSPVGSLTNLLTDMSSSIGFKKVMDAEKDLVDKNKEISMILARNKSFKRDHFKSINSKLFGSSASHTLDGNLLMG